MSKDPLLLASVLWRDLKDHLDHLSLSQRHKSGKGSAKATEPEKGLGSSSTHPPSRNSSAFLQHRAQGVEDHGKPGWLAGLWAELTSVSQHLVKH